MSGAEHLDRAVDASKKAFKWSKVPFEERKRTVLAYGDAVDASSDESRPALSKWLSCVQHIPS